MSLKHTLKTGAARAAFAQPLGLAFMVRGAQVTYAPEDDAGQGDPPQPAADPPAAEIPEGAAAPEALAEGDPPAGEAPEGAGDPPAEEPKKPKSPVAQLQGRVGHLTKLAHEKDATIADQAARLAAMEALLKASGKEADPAATGAHSSTLTKGSAEWNEAVKAEAKELAAAESFTKQCNDIFAQGVEKHGDTFKEATANLNALGMMDANLVQDAIATGSAAEVINALGQDVDEAQRITSLPPVSMAVELTKLAGKLQAPKEAKQVSKTPAPINPVGSSAGKQDVDLAAVAKDDDMSAYVAARKAQGSRWAK